MLRTNLSTRPFYNTRAVGVALGLLAAAVVAITLFNVVEILRLTTSQQSLGARATEAEGEAGRLRVEAARVRSQIDPQELRVVADAAREANAIIDRRAFSWTGLFVKFEATLPPDVRVTAIRPRVDNGRFVVSIGVEARSPESLDAFMEALESRGGFRNVLAVAEQTSLQGLLQAIVEGTYPPPPRDVLASAPGEIER